MTALVAAAKRTPSGVFARWDPLLRIPALRAKWARRRRGCGRRGRSRRAETSERMRAVALDRRRRRASRSRAAKKKNTAQAPAWTPWSIDGIRRCIERDPNERTPAVTRFTQSARTVPGPSDRARSPATHALQGCSARSGDPRSSGSRILRKKFREPVASSSTESADFPLPRTALELGFDLTTLRAPCRQQRTGGLPSGQAASGRSLSANSENFSFGPPSGGP